MVDGNQAGDRCARPWVEQFARGRRYDKPVACCRKARGNELERILDRGVCARRKGECARESEAREGREEDVDSWFGFLSIHDVMSGVSFLVGSEYLKRMI